MPVVNLTDRSLSRKPPATGQLELFDTVVPGFGLRISYGGRRTFFVMTRIHGRQVRRTLGTTDDLTLADARDKARRAKGDAAAGIDPKDAERKARVEAERSRRSTFRAVAEDYLADKGEGGGATLRTHGELKRKLEVDVLPEWGDRPIREITRSDVRELLRDKARTSPVSANRTLALVRRIFGWALGQELVDASPAFRIPRPGGQERERERVLTLEEIRSIWSACDRLGYPFGPLIKLLILTAQRRNEVAGLSWREVEGEVWRLPGERAKAGKGHLVPLSPLAQSILEDAPRIGDKPTLIFTTGRRRGKSNDGDTLAPAAVSGWSRMKRRLDRITAEMAAEAAEEELDLTRHGIPGWTLHDIRRSVATHMRDEAAMGAGKAVERLTVSKILNHSEGGMTRIYDRYAADREKREALEAWAEKVERLVGLNVESFPSGKSRA